MSADIRWLAQFCWGLFGGLFQAVLRLGCEGEPMALTDTAIKLAKDGDVDRKMADEKGL